ncbi:hypothetical protein [Streptomyces nigra]
MFNTSTRTQGADSGKQDRGTGTEGLSGRPRALDIRLPGGAGQEARRAARVQDATPTRPVGLADVLMRMEMRLDEHLA